MDHIDPAMRDGIIGTDHSHVKSGRAYVYFERYIDQPQQQVWQAITNPAQARGWLGSLEIEPRAGGRIAFRLDGTEPIHGSVTEGEITAYDAPRLLACWTFFDEAHPTDKPHLLRFELLPQAPGTLLKFTHTFAEGDRARNSIVCGWHAKLEQIADTAAGKPTNWQTWDRSRIIELYWHYRNKPRS